MCSHKKGINTGDLLSNTVGVLYQITAKDERYLQEVTMFPSQNVVVSEIMKISEIFRIIGIKFLAGGRIPQFQYILRVDLVRLYGVFPILFVADSLVQCSPERVATETKFSVDR